MKRTTEFVLGIIGVILSAFTLLGGLFFAFAGGSNEVMDDVRMQMEADPAIDADLMTESLNVLSSIGWLFVVAAAFGIIFGIIGIVNIKGDKKPKLAGWMFIIGAILLGLLTIGFGFLPALLLLIAGIMSLARKSEPQETIY